jgi:glycosyltransferase involved in cell wall biosynthesis
MIPGTPTTISNFSACTVVVVPCYNVASTCGPIVREATKYAQHVVAVNDGSSDDTERILRLVACEFNHVHILSFPKNRGKGAALIEAFRYALSHFPFRVLVTLDSDGQHQPSDITQLVKTAICEQADLVMGERLERGHMPWRSRLGNNLTMALVRWLYPSAPRDTQSGMRALSFPFLADVVEVIKGRRYETELEILLLALEQRRALATFEIETVYFQDNRFSHFKPIRDSWRVYRMFFRWILKDLRRPLKAKLFTISTRNTGS